MAVRARGRVLYLDFYCYLPDGRRTRCVETTGLRDNHKNRKIAEAKDKAIKYELKYGRFNYLHYFPRGSKAKHFQKESSRMLFAEWWEKWLNEKSIRPNSLKVWTSRYRVHLEPHFGHAPLSEIDESALLVFRKKLEAQHYRRSYINNIMKVLCSCLLKAHNRGLTSDYPCRDIRSLTEERIEIDPLSFEELRHLLDFLEGYNPEWHDFVFIWSRTGLRVGEICALKWKHIDWFNRKLMIRETRYDSGQEGPPKTSHSLRDVDLRPAVIETLQRQKARTGLMDKHVFLNHNSRPWTPVTLHDRFRHILRLAELKYRSPKQLRHTFATLHIAAKENISWVSRMLGHSSVEITLRRYNRFIPNLTHEDGAAFERIMEGEGRFSNNLSYSET